MASSSLLFLAPFITSPNCNSVPSGSISKISGSCRFGNPTLNSPVYFRPCHLRRSRSHSNSSPTDEVEEEGLVQELRVPENWLDPSNALEESEWLRVTLHKWLDDEYCPEETNIDISNVAAHSFYESLVEKQTDLGVILLKMARELESISYQESFHGAFSSANAAINLIIQRIEQS